MVLQTLCHKLKKKTLMKPLIEAIKPTLAGASGLTLMQIAPVNFHDIANLAIVVITTIFQFLQLRKNKKSEKNSL